MPRLSLLAALLAIAAATSVPGAGQTSRSPPRLISLPNGSQQKSYSCSVAGLRVALMKLRGIKVPERVLAQELGLTLERVPPPTAIKRLAERYGLRVRLRSRMSLPELARLSDPDGDTLVMVPYQAWPPEPTDLSQGEEQGHYSLVAGVERGAHRGDETVYFEDPAYFGGFTSLPGPEFLKRWHDDDYTGRQYRRFGIIFQAPTEADRSPAAKKLAWSNRRMGTILALTELEAERMRAKRQAIARAAADAKLLDSLQGHPAWLPREGCHTNDLPTFLSRLERVAARRGFRLRTLHHPGAAPIRMLEPIAPSNGPHVLISTGFHGDEPGGPWGVLRFLEEAPPDLFARVNLTILPLVNEEGFVRDMRLNARGEDINRGFTLRDPARNSVSRQSDLTAYPSAEGRALLAHSPELVRAARDGMLSLHEDRTATTSYIYAYDPAKAETRLLLSGLRNVLFSRFARARNDAVPGVAMRNGVIDAGDDRDGSFDQFMWERRVPRIVTTETPGMLDPDVRVSANAQLVESYLRSVLAAASPAAR
jgi:hypothetical protein